MASFYAPTIKVNDVPMDPVSTAAQFPVLFAAFPDWHWEMRNLLIDGDYVAVHFTVTGTHRGAFNAIEATGRRVSSAEITLYHVEGGKFSEVWDFGGMEAVESQIREAEAP